MQDRFDESLDFLARGLEVQETNILANIATLTESQQRDYLSTIDYSEDLIVSLHLQHLPTNPQASATALTTILRRKGRILDTLSNSLQRIRANAKPEDLARLNQLSQLHTQLTNLYNQGGDRAQIQGLQAQIEQLQTQLAQNNPEFNPEPVTLDAIRDLLPPNTALIEYFRYQPVNLKATQGEGYGDPHYAAYILTPQGDPIGIDLGLAEPLDRAMGLFRNYLHDTSTPRFRAEARHLHTLLIAPLLPHLGNTTHLLLSPDSQLNILPFAALLNDQNQYLIQTHQLTTLSSGRDLVRFQTHQPSQQPPILLANPTYDDPANPAAISRIPQPQRLALRGADLRGNTVPFPWDALPGTAIEANLIQSKFPGLLTLTQDQATENAAKALNRPRILHLATHGFFLPDAPDDATGNPLLRSGLVFAGANLQNPDRNQGEDGILTALEISGLDLRGTQLVVLSACETGLGDVANGEGVYGLGRALTLAGAESQLRSLWKVSDTATQMLLTRYYDYLLAGKGRSEAWRQTQLDMIQGNLGTEVEDFTHPYYWSALVPAGNWEPLPSP